MEKVCEVCGHVYDETETGVSFDQLPEDWWCPNCGADKDCFEDKEYLIWSIINGK